MASQNVVDTMVLVLGLDTTQFTQQQRAALDLLRKMHEEGEKQGARVESQTKRLGETLVSFKREFVSAIGLVFGGTMANRAIDYITNLDAATGRLSKTINMNASELSAWQGLFKQIGGSAEEANAALAGLSGAVNMFNISGQVSPALLQVAAQLRIPGGLFKDGKPKTPDLLLREFSTALQGRDPAEATAILSMVPGMNQTMVNALLEGPQSIDRRLRKARETGGTTEESAKVAQQYQESTAQFERSVTQFGRVMSVFALPAFAKFVDWLTESMTSLTDSDQQRKRKEAERLKERGGITTTDEMRERFGGVYPEVETVASWLFGGTPDRRGQEQRFRPAPSRPAIPRPIPITQGGGAGLPTAAEMEAYIRTSAATRGIDPEIAVRVAKSEGLYAYLHSQTGQSFVPGEQSFGPFQLNYGPGGLGKKFTRQTGRNASDASTWQQQVDFSLDEAKRSGWGPWHGWKGSPNAGLFGAPGAAVAGMGGGRGDSSTSVSIGTIQVNAPQAKDANGIAAEIEPALRRSLQAGSANTGAQ